MEDPKPLELDVRPLCEIGQAPLGTILDAVDTLAPGQDLILVVPFEPLPLYGLLAQRGFTHKTHLREDDAWEITFHPGVGL